MRAHLSIYSSFYFCITYYFKTKCLLKTLYSWIWKSGIYAECNGVGLSLFHNVWHLSLNVSVAGCVSMAGSWNHLETPSLTYLATDSGCHLWPHMGVLAKAYAYGLSQWLRLSQSGLVVAGLLTSCPRIKWKTLSLFMT